MENTLVTLMSNKDQAIARLQSRKDILLQQVEKCLNDNTSYAEQVDKIREINHRLLCLKEMP
jgi:hypothetical protein